MPRELSYNRVHIHLRKTRGRAAEMDCLHCANPAQEWALNHREPNENFRLSPRGLVYSLNFADYLPLCKRCHRAFDEWYDKTHPLT